MGAPTHLTTAALLSRKIRGASTPEHHRSIQKLSKHCPHAPVYGCLRLTSLVLASPLLVSPSLCAAVFLTLGLGLRARSSAEAARSALACAAAAALAAAFSALAAARAAAAASAACVRCDETGTQRTVRAGRLVRAQPRAKFRGVIQ